MFNFEISFKKKIAQYKNMKLIFVCIDVPGNTYL